MRKLMNIRKADKKDTEKILDLLVQVCNVHSAARPDLFIKDTTKYTEEQLLNIMADPNTPVFVAVDEDDKVLGYCFGMFMHMKSNNMPDKTTYYIDDLCVDEKCRGRHIGRELYKHALQFAKNSGCYNVTLNVWNKNDNAIAFYKSCGMEIQKYGMEQIL